MYTITYIIFIVNFLFFESKVESGSNDYHAEGKYMSERHPSSEYITNLDIGCTEKFYTKSHHTIPTQKPDSELTVVFYFFSFPEEDSEQQYSFEESFEEWSWEIVCAIDISSEESIVSRQPHEFTIDVIPYSSKKETNRNYPDELIRNSEKWFFDFLWSDIPCDNNSESSSMKWHTPLPRHEYLKRIIEIISEIIEKHIAKSPT